MGMGDVRLLVCGGRDFANIAFIWRTLDRLHDETPVAEIITGGCRGVDVIANDWAKTKPIKRYVSRVTKKDWQSHGKAAGPLRNAHMLEWKPDVVIAFPGNNGTADMVRQAMAAGVKVIKVA